jgi:flagellin-like hook-associated protein FlgL
VGDFNGDGLPDLVSADQGSNTLSVLLGNGNGTFQAKQTYATGTEPLWVSAGDFNGDGKPDLVSADYNSNVLSVFLANGDGTFQARQTYATGSNPASVEAADLNSDGVLDLVAADYSSNTVSVLLGNVGGTSTSTLPLISTISGISVATQSQALTAQGSIDSLLDTLNGAEGIIGSYLSRFQTAISNLQVSSENFKAAESRITNADLASETSTLTRTQILLQAGAAVLAQANQTPDLALKLLQG